jgi:tetratricopeptide (TPR) repeat protein
MYFEWNKWRRAPDLLARGAAAYSHGHWNEAADLARRRLKAAPQDIEAVRLLARATARLGRDAPANALFARLGSDALQAEDLFLLGIGLDRAGRRGEAARLWEKAVRLEPDRAEVIDRLVGGYIAQKRLVEAAQLAERLAEQPGWELHGELAAGALRAELGEPTAAATTLKRALARPEAARLDQLTATRTRKLLARALLRTARAGEARAVLRSILADGLDPEASWLSSRAALLEGDRIEAAGALEAAGSYRADHPLEAEPGPYIGAARCAVCHREVFRAVAASRHASTLIRGKPLAGLPYPVGPVADPDLPGITHEFHHDGHLMKLETRTGGEVLRAVVDYAFGSPDHYVSLVGRDEHGHWRILRLSRYRSQGDSGWVRTTGHSADGAGGTDLQGKSLDLADGLFKCLFCHSTNPRSVLDDAGPASHDRGIGCERCHGPGAIHEKAVSLDFPDLAIVNPTKATAEGRLQLCGQCHSHHQELSLARTDPYWIRFQGTTLTWSRCYTESKGALDCMSCHDPHHDTDRTEAHYTAQCLSCHSPAPAASAIDAPREPAAPAKKAQRGSTCPVNATGGCIGCHMPAFQSAALHASFTDHYIRVRSEQHAQSLK